MQNMKIREFAKQKKVHLWQIAEELGIQDSALSRKLRKELPREEEQHILAIIGELAEEAQHGRKKD